MRPSVRPSVCLSETKIWSTFRCVLLEFKGVAERTCNKNSNFVTGARIAVLLCTETTQKIYRSGAEVDFFSRSRYYNKNYGYPSTSDEGYFFSETVNSYEFYHLEFTISESFKELRCYFRDWQSVYYV